jgi:hypothetical protein
VKRLIAAIPVLALLGSFTPSALAAPGGGISGKVTSAAAKHEPIEGVEVCAFELSAEASEEEVEGDNGCATTNSSGEYTISGLSSANFGVIFNFAAIFGSSLSGTAQSSVPNYVVQYYKDELPPTEPTPVAVSGSATTKEIDAELQEGSEITGTLTEAATGNPVAKGSVCALRSASGGIELVGCASTGPSGEYKIVGLPDGSYVVGFFGAGLATRFYQGKTSFGEATQIAITAAGEVKTGIDEALQPAAPPPSGVGAPTSPTSTPGAQLPGLAGPLSPPQPLAVKLVSPRVAVRDGTLALVKLACAGSASCHGELELKSTRTVRHDGKAAKETVTIGTVDYTLKHGETATFKIELAPTGRRLLSSGRGRLAVRLAISELEPTPTRTVSKRIELVDTKDATKR